MVQHLCNSIPSINREQLSSVAQVPSGVLLVGMLPNLVRKGLYFWFIKIIDRFPLFGALPSFGGRDDDDDDVAFFEASGFKVDVKGKEDDGGFLLLPSLVMQEV